MKNNKTLILFLLVAISTSLSCAGIELIDEFFGGGSGFSSGSELAGPREDATDTAAVKLTETAMASITPSATPLPTETPTTTPNPAWDYFRDASGDEVVCGGSNTEDGVVDIRPITFKHENFAIDVIEIGMGEAPGSAFSYAVVIFLQSDRQPLRAFIYEIHDGVKKIGEIDPATFEIITPTETVEGFDIYLDGSNVIFEFPEDFFPNGMNDFFVQSFHMKSEGDSTNCDDAEGSRTSE